MEWSRRTFWLSVSLVKDLIFNGKIGRMEVKRNIREGGVAAVFVHFVKIKIVQMNFCQPSILIF